MPYKEQLLPLTLAELEGGTRRQGAPAEQPVAVPHTQAGSSTTAAVAQHAQRTEELCAEGLLPAEGQQGEQQAGLGSESSTPCAAHRGVVRGVDHNQLGRAGAANQVPGILQTEGQGAVGGAAGEQVVGAGLW